MIVVYFFCTMLLKIFLIVFVIFLILGLIALITKNDRMMRKVGKPIVGMFIAGIVLGCIIGIFQISGLFSLKSPVNDKVDSIKGADSCFDSVCANDTDIYIYLDQDGIYRYVSDDKLELVKNLGDSYCQAIACTNCYIIFIDETGKPYRLDLKTKEELSLLDQEAYRIYANGEDFFIEDSDGILWLFQGDSAEGVNIDQYMKTHCSLTEEDSNVSCTYNDYTFYGSSKSEEISIFLIEKGNWQESAGDYESCKLEDDIVYFTFHMEQAGEEREQTAWCHYKDSKTAVLPDIDMEEAFLNNLSVVNDNKIYSLVKYGMEFKEPVGWYPTKEALLMVSPTDHAENSCIFSVDIDHERIIGMDIENNRIYLYNAGSSVSGGKIYEVDITNNEKTLLKKDIDNTGILHFSWEGDRLFIMKESGTGRFSLVGTVKGRG